MVEPMTIAVVSLVVIEVIVAAIIDARTRTFPLALMVLMAATCVLCSYVLGGFERALFGLASAMSACLPLVGFEVLWRRAHAGAPGLGMGDIKFLAAFMMAWPLGALLSFAGGLVLLAMAGVACKRPSLPLIPFIVAAAPLVALVL